LNADARDFVYIEYFLDPYDLGPYLMPTLFIADAIKATHKTISRSNPLRSSLLRQFGPLW